MQKKRKKTRFLADFWPFLGFCTKVCELGRFLKSRLRYSARNPCRKIHLLRGPRTPKIPNFGHFWPFFGIFCTFFVQSLPEIKTRFPPLIFAFFANTFAPNSRNFSPKISYEIPTSSEKIAKFGEISGNFGHFPGQTPS